MSPAPLPPMNRMPQPQRRPSQDSTADGIRKRVCKACDRCRLKKSKCDGGHPCSRCKADNAICVFGERKKSHDKVYPKGYVEMLEQQQGQLVSGLQELYRRLRSKEAWTGPVLPESNGHALTHDILSALNILETKHDGQGEVETFQEDFQKLQSKLVAEGAYYVRRRESFSSDSEHSQQDHARSPTHNPPTSAKPQLFKESYNFASSSPSPLSQSPAPQQRQSYPPAQRLPLQPSPLANDPQLYQSEWALEIADMSDPEQTLRSKYALQTPELSESHRWDSMDNFLQHAGWEGSEMSYDTTYNNLTSYRQPLYNGGMQSMCTSDLNMLDQMDVDFSKYI